MYILIHYVLYSWKNFAVNKFLPIILSNKNFFLILKNKNKNKNKIKIKNKNKILKIYKIMNNKNILTQHL